VKRNDACGETDCSGLCVDTGTDEANCGACGTACAIARRACWGSGCGCRLGPADAVQERRRVSSTLARCPQR